MILFQGIKKRTMKNQKGTILITGASSGIGYETALHLDMQGYNVYAGYRKIEDGFELTKQAVNGLISAKMDVTDLASIQEVYEQIVSEFKHGPFYLINNAGLSVNGPLEMLGFDDIKKMIDVNLTGLLTVTKVFLPLIRKTKGRIINISSGHGLMAIPDKSVYSASKFGVQAVSDSLRVELRPFDVQVSSIVVGKVDTKVLGKIEDDRQKMISTTDPDLYNQYKTLVEFFDKEVKTIPGIEAIEVAKVIHQALSDKNPKDKYLVGPGAKKMSVLGKFPAKMRDRMLYKSIYK